MPGKFRLKIATASQVLNRFPLHEAIALLAETGYDGIEIWATDLEKQLADKTTSRELVRTSLINNRMDALIHGPVTDHESTDKTKYNISSRIKRLRDKSIEENLLSMDFADELGSKLIVVHPGHRDNPGDEADTEYWDLQIDALKILAGKAGQMNMKMAIELMENRGKEFVTLPEDMLRILNAIDSGNTGITFDITHAFTHGPDKPAEFLESLKTQIFHVHISGYSDYKTHVPFYMSSLPSGYLDAALNKLVRHYSGFITVEGHLKGIMDDTRENEKMVATMNMEYILKELKSIHLV